MPTPSPSAILALALTALFIAGAPIPSHAASGYAFVSPKPGSRDHPPAVTVTIREGRFLDPAGIGQARIEVRGSASGDHPGRLVLSDDGRTAVFHPAEPFRLGERVTVRLPEGLRTREGDATEPLETSFGIAARPRATGARDPIEAALRGWPADAAAVAPPSLENAPADSLPADWLPIQVTAWDHPGPGAVFLAPFRITFRQDRGRLAIVDHNGFPLFYRSVPGFVFDFKRQPNGWMTYFTPPYTYVALDSTGIVVDEFQCGNGYQADEHDLQLLPDGHALLLAYDYQPVAMNAVVPGGHPNATVIGLIIQELDQAKNVVFEWRSWDHFEITDLVECASMLTDSLVDYVHANSVERDADGNLLISSRHMNEITKIDRETGEVIWRFGPNAKNNQFNVIGDVRGFSHQHDVRRLPNGNLSLFDNGNCMAGGNYSRGVEYELDEDNLIARLVREIRESPDQFGPFMGNVQHREDGGITIGWGGSAASPKMSERRADGTTTFALGFPTPLTWTYRAFRFPWVYAPIEPDREAEDFGLVAVGETASATVGITNRRDTPLTITHLPVTDPRYEVVASLPIVLAPGARDQFELRFSPDSLGPMPATLYVRSVCDTELVARAIPLAGSGDGQGISVANLTLAEGDPAIEVFFNFRVHLEKPATEPVSFDFSVEDSTAIAWQDYIPVSGTRTFEPGQQNMLVPVLVLGDDVPEDNEVFHLRLTNVTNAIVVKAMARAIILHDEGVLDVESPGSRRATLSIRDARPNPARGRVEFAFELPVAGDAELAIFDLRGRRVATLANGPRPAGPQHLVWRAAGRAPGVYLAWLRSGGRTAQRKFVLLR